MTIDGGDGSSASGKREQALQQDEAAVCQVFLLELPCVSGRGVEPRDELVAGEPVLLVLVGHVDAHGLLVGELLVVLELLPVEAHVGEEGGF